MVGYSRFVRVMKLLLPVFALMLLLVIVLWPQIKPKDINSSARVTSLGLDDTDGVNMINPRYVGIDTNNRPFSITADLARTLTDQNDIIELEMPKVDLELENNTGLILTANTGNYYQKEKRLDLKGSVSLFHDTGYEIHTEQAFLDLTTNIAFTDQYVRGQGPFGELTADDGFELRNESHTIFLKGKSYVQIYPDIKRGDGG